MPRKSRKIKKSKRNTKRIKGGISNYTFSALYTIVKERARILFDMRRLNEEIDRINGKRTNYNEQNPERRMRLIVLTDEHWGELITKAYTDGIQFYFDNSELGQRLKGSFSYTSSFPAYKGSFSRETLKKLYSFVSSNAKNSIPMKEMKDIVDVINKTNDVEKHVLSDIEWCELTAECYFRDRIYFIFDESEKERHFSRIFDYTYLDLYFNYLGKIVDDRPRAPRPSTRYVPQSPPRTREPPPPPRKPHITDYLPPYEPIESPPRARDQPPLTSTLEPSAPSILADTRGAEQPTIQNRLSSLLRTLSVSQSVQGAERTCFAHSAALIIFHNVYDVPLKDIELYAANNCNSYLNTTKPLPDYTEIQKRCGISGAERILLFRYIYQVIVKEYGCDGGHAILAMKYYLKNPFNPKIFPTLNETLMPLHAKGKYSNFAVSSIKMSDYSKTYEPYLDEYLRLYYATISTEKPRHAIVITGRDIDGLLGKDSMYGVGFHIPFSELRPDGVVHLEKSESQKKTLEGIRHIAFLYDKTARFSAGLSKFLEDTIV